MRTAFIRELFDMAAADPRVTLLVGDLGYSVVEDFAARFPKQFVNAGVAEQNMAGLAAGLALAGRRVFTYSIANFPTLRCLEQIRNDICYHSLNVHVVAVGGGFAYGSLGASHHATEDLAIMRALPNMTVLAPGDPVEAGHATRALAAHQGPAYLRLGKTGEPVVHDREPAFRIGEAIRVREGRDCTIIATGGMLAPSVAAADELSAAHGVQAAVLSMHTVKPIDAGAVRAAAAGTPILVTVEEHSIIGGLGGAVAEVLAELDGPRPRFRRLGLPSRFATTGDQQHLKSLAGLSVPALVQSLLALMTPAAAAAGPDR